MAENQGRHGARHEIEINENNAILDGERRWRSLRLRGEIEAEVIVVVGVTTPEQIEEYVVDAFDSNRDPDIEEQVNLYRLAQRVLARRHGRGRGRPGKMLSNDNVIWSAKKIREEAARVGRFPSYVTAARAAKVLAEGDDELRAALRSGDLTVNAAYEKLASLSKAKKPKKSKTQARARTQPTEAEPEQEQPASGDDEPASADDRPENADAEGSEPAGDHEPTSGEGAADTTAEATPAESPPAPTTAEKEALVVVLRAVKQRGQATGRRVINSSA